jgi:hypothetical protein
MDNNSQRMRKNTCFKACEYLIIVKSSEEFIGMKYPNRKLLFTFTAEI